MARSSWHDHTHPADAGRDGQPARPDDDTVGAATRAVADATAALTKLLGNQLASVSTELGDAIATSLRDAARGLADASETVERRSGGQRADERRRARVDRTRADLLAAAGRVFAAQGYEGASVGDIAAEAGYTKGALYAHFGSKSDLFVALARERLDCDRPTAPATGPATRSLADELSAGVAGTGDDPSMLLALEMLAYAVRHPEARDDLGPLFDASLQALAVRVRDDRLARSHGATAPDATAGVSRDDLDTALGLLAVTNVSAMLAAITDDPAVVAAAGGRLVDRLLTP